MNQHDDLDPDLRDGFDELRRGPMPSDLLEERVVRALRAKGLLQSRRTWRRLAGAAAAVAASLLLFVSGLLVGRSQARPPAAPAPQEVQAPTAGKTATPEPLRQVYWF